MMARKITKKQKDFADKYLETGNGTQSALKSYDIQGKDPEKIASVIAVENLGKPSVQQYLEEHAEGAIERIVELSKTAENESVKLAANKDIADRAGYKAPERHINLNIDAEIVNPRAKELAEEYEKKLKENL